jgi:hypothetical protein
LRCAEATWLGTVRRDDATRAAMFESLSPCPTNSSTRLSASVSADE